MMTSVHEKGYLVKLKKTLAQMRIFLFLLLNLFSFSLYSQIQYGNEINGVEPGDQSGGAISFSADGTRLAIGADRNDATGVNAGHVRIFKDINGVWSQIGSDIEGEAGFDQSGISVSMSSDGKRVAIGAFANNGTGSNAGHTRIFEEIGGLWVQVGSDIDAEATDDRSGFSVSLSSDGTRVAIGAYFNDGLGSNSGHVRVLEENDGVWAQLGNDIDGEAADDNAGFAVSLSANGTRVAIGSPRNNGNGENAGSVRIFEELGGEWTQIGSDIDGQSAGDMSGSAISLSPDGHWLAIGAWESDVNGENSGQVRVFQEVDGIWTQIGSDINGQEIGENSGNSVSLSINGTRLVVGHPGSDVNGENSGFVRIYDEIGGIWTQLGNDIVGEEDGDWFGLAVSLTSDGTRLAVGAPFSDRGGVWSGQVKVYEDIGLSTNIIGTGHQKIINNILLFPNPSTGLVQLEVVNLYKQNIQIKIYDSLGREFWKSELINEKLNWEEEINFKNTGAYFLTISAGLEILDKRIIIIDRE